MTQRASADRPIPVRYSEMRAPAPEFQDVQAEFARICSAFAQAASAGARTQVIREWEELRRRIDSWASLVQLRFHQDTRNPDYNRDREQCDEQRPRFTELEVAFKRVLLDSPHRSELEREFGRHAFDLWEHEARTFDPRIKADLVQESKLTSEYVMLLATAQIPLQGETHTISGIRRFLEDSSRQTRHAAASAMWAWFQSQGERLDGLFDELVRLRARMAAALAHPSFTELGYHRMARVDYGPAEVDRFREEVLRDVVPLCARLREQQARRLGVDAVRYWDETVFGLGGNPAPAGGADWMIEQASTMFGRLGGGLDEFFAMMRERDLLDLEGRDGKAGGGFCTTIPIYRAPFIFANFNGTKGDVEVFTHEAGHAFQAWKSDGVRLYDYVQPTTESCEIHSMGLEFLTWPYMELFFGGQADSFRRIHLEQSLQFLPYGVAVDHFQHLVYANPTASAAERHEMWRQMEQRYLPWRDYGDVAYPAKGGYWQYQRHIYLLPFYYIDYTLALTCALQFWELAEQDREPALERYVALCERGGEIPFRQLVASIGFTSPFDPGSLRRVVDRVSAFLGI